MQSTAEKVLMSETAESAFAPRWTFELPNGMQISSNYIQAVLIVFMIFLIILSVARLRHMYVNWSLKGAVSMIGFGFLLALVLEGLLIIGGRTLFTEVLGWENAPKPISVALDAGRLRLVNVLGVTDSIPESSADTKSEVELVVKQINSLDVEERAQLFENYCSPN